MEQDVFVGLDVHKKTIVATALDKEGRKLDQTEMSAYDDEVVDHLRALPGRKHVVLEACSVWEHVYDAAGPLAAIVKLAHPKKTRLIAEATLKTDRVDSLALANLMRMNGVAEAYAPDEPTRELRRIVRDRQFYKGQQVSVKNHTYSFLLRRGVQYEDGILGLKRKREALRGLNIPEVDRGLDMLKKIEETCKELDEEIHRAYEASKEAQLLASIPGVGELTAVTLVAEICPIDRFPNIEKLCAYAGVVPSTRQSGETVHHGHIIRDSNKLLRSVLVEATWIHKSKDKQSDVTRKAKRLTRKRGKGIGSIAGAHKLLRIIYAILKRGTPYTPERPGRVQGPAKP
jgi:transposase